MAYSELSALLPYAVIERPHSCQPFRLSWMAQGGARPERVL